MLTRFAFTFICAAFLAACDPGIQTSRLRSPDGGVATYLHPLGGSPTGAVEVWLDPCKPGSAAPAAVLCTIENNEGGCGGLTTAEGNEACTAKKGVRRVTLSAPDNRGLRYVVQAGSCPIPFSVVRKLADESLAAAVSNGCYDVAQAERAHALILGTATVSTYELLNQRYGLTHAGGLGGYVDVVPGMRLRVEYATYPRDAIEDDPNVGYVGSGVAHYTLSELTDGRREFDPFLPPMFAELRPGSEVPRRAVSTLELQDIGGMPYLRLFYPPALSRQTLSERPSPTAEDNAVLVRTRSPFELPVAHPTQSDCTDSSRMQCIYFRHAGLPVPEIRVEVRGRPEWVSVGSTLRTVLERSVPLRLDGAVDSILNRVRVRRVHPGGTQPINLAPAGRAALDLPLIQGDEISW